MKFGSLFSGIGAFDLGLSRAGMTCEWQVELDEFCRNVLAKHWPDVRRWDDIKTFPPTGPIDEWRVDLLAGGFPCQPVSHAGKREGEHDQQGRWLWPEMFRVCKLLRPRWVLVENVLGLLSAGDVRGSLFGGILRDLASIGYCVEWHCLSAGGPEGFSGPHRRRRIWIIAHPGIERIPGLVPGKNPGLVGPWQWRGKEDLCNISSTPTKRGDRWPQPIIRRVDDGTSSRVDRLRAIGNAVAVPVVEVIGRSIMEAERSPE